MELSNLRTILLSNWLRDYSQAVDIAVLKKLPLQSIINICMALGFLVSWCQTMTFEINLLIPTPQAHGYATAEFEVTANRLGVYLPVSIKPSKHLSWTLG